MINIHDAYITDAICHYIPDASSGADLVHGSMLDLEAHGITGEVLHLTTQNFKEPSFFAFTFNDDDFILNPLYNYAGNIFDEDSFLENSIKIARYLFDKSRHPFVKPGELLIARIQNILVCDEMTNGLALVKLENPRDFLHFQRNLSGLQISKTDGFELDKVDKACLILESDRDVGFKILNIDQSNKNNDAKYWRDEFLRLKEVTNDYLATKEYIRLTANFVKSKDANNFFEGKAEKAGVLSKSEKYFSTQEKFEEAEFINTVFENDVQKEAFQSYKSLTEENSQKQFEPNFEISEMASKKYGKVFKSVIKLDKNFHIYVHGDHKMIRKGVDEEGRKFYQLFYEDEA